MDRPEPAASTRKSRCLSDRARRGDLHGVFYKVRRKMRCSCWHKAPGVRMTLSKNDAVYNQRSLACISSHPTAAALLSSECCPAQAWITAAEPTSSLVPKNTIRPSDSRHTSSNRLYTCDIKKSVPHQSCRPQRQCLFLQVLPPTKFKSPTTLDPRQDAPLECFKNMPSGKAKAARVSCSGLERDVGNRGGKTRGGEAPRAPAAADSS